MLLKNCLCLSCGEGLWLTKAEGAEKTERALVMLPSLLLLQNPALQISRPCIRVGGLLSEGHKGAKRWASGVEFGAFFGLCALAFQASGLEFKVQDSTCSMGESPIKIRF